VDELRPNVAQALGGPFNGQDRRVEAVRGIFDAIPFVVVVETGTFRGTTTLFLRELTSAPIATVEISPRYYHYSRRRLRQAQGINVIHGPSPAAIRMLSADPQWNRSPAFFYLDAHWLADLPLLSEINEIARGWRDYAVMVDDFRVPDDPGYDYDDYGFGKVLEPALLVSAPQSLAVFWPSAGSEMETGARRGSVVLATTGPISDALSRVQGLRPGGSLSDLVNGAAG
jgi:hypothetical protein